MNKPLHRDPGTPRTPRTDPLMTLVLIVEALSSIGAPLLQMGIFFYTSQIFGWSLWANFLLAMAQGATYTAGALLASRLSRWLGERRFLVVVLLAVSALALAAAIYDAEPFITAALIVYVFLIALTWPVLEAMISRTDDPHEMSRRIGIYNVVWAGAIALILPLAGTVIEHWPRGMFLIPLAMHAASAALILLFPASPGDVADPVMAAPAHPQAEAELLRQRTLALWLSRIALPAMYVVSNSLMAMMPSMPVLQQLSPVWQTIFASVWIVARWVMFLLLTATAFWHTRPRLLLIAALGLLVSFLVTTTPPSQLLPELNLSLRVDLTLLVLGQIGLGIAMGLIYMSSLYFGMVLSEGSTEHGGYHEALIGLGFVLGPAAGALSQWLWPENVTAAVLSVATVVMLSILLCATASLRLGRRVDDA